MRPEHRGREKLFIDYSDGLSIVDTTTGELTLTQLFVAVWGASNYTCVEDPMSQTLPVMCDNYYCRSATIRIAG